MSEAQAHSTNTNSENDEFYVRYYFGHKGEYGHEFTEFELAPSGLLRYCNNSHYKHEEMIRKEVFVSPAVVDETRRIVLESGICKVNDSNWKEPSPESGRQELEIKIGNEHIAFTCQEIGSLGDIDNDDGLKVFYYTTQDLKTLMFSLITMHYKVSPI